MPIVSLVIPVYNTEKWLHRCLDSVLAQTYQDWECILVDDESKDTSPAILDEYAARDSRFRVFHERNRGSSLARRFGIDKAQGEWLVFMDSDDDVHPYYVQSLYEAATSHNFLIAACNMQKVANDAEPKTLNFLKPSETLNPEELHRRFFAYDFWGFWGKIYHRTVFEGVYFPKYNINEDYVVMSQLFARQKSIGYIPAALYYYRTNPESLSHIKLTSRIMDEFYNKKWVTEYYESIQKEGNALDVFKGYAARAMDLQAETAIKLCHIIKSEDLKREFDEELKILKFFLKENFWHLVNSRNLLLGLKKEIIKVVLFY